MSTTDTSEKGLETLIMRHLTGVDGLGSGPEGVVQEVPLPAGNGWLADIRLLKSVGDGDGDPGKQGRNGKANGSMSSGTEQTSGDGGRSSGCRLLSSSKVTLPEAYAGCRGTLAVRHEEDALCWLWAYPALLPWPSPVWWLYTPVVGNTRWPGDLWGVDARGELLILECKQCRRGDDPFHDFVRYHRPGRDEFTAAHWLTKWARHLRAERAFPDATTERPAGRTDGLLPRSNRRAHIRRWPALAALMDAHIRSPEYEEAVRAALRVREQAGNPSPHYMALMVVSADQDVLAGVAEASSRELQKVAGEGRVHVVTTRADVATACALRVSCAPGALAPGGGRRR